MAVVLRKTVRTMGLDQTWKIFCAKNGRSRKFIDTNPRYKLLPQAIIIVRDLVQIQYKNIQTYYGLKRVGYIYVSINNLMFFVSTFLHHKIKKGKLHQPPNGTHSVPYLVNHDEMNCHNTSSTAVYYYESVTRVKRLRSD
jgi:hypothetical protein